MQVSRGQWVGSLYILFLLCCCTVFLTPQVQAQRADPDKKYQLDLNDVSVGNAVKILVELSGVNIVATREASDLRVSFSVRDLAMSDVIDSLCRVAGLWYRYNNDTGVYIIMSEVEYKKDVVIYRNEETKVFVLKHQNVSYAAEAIAALYGDRVSVTKPAKNASYKLDGDFDSGGGSGSGSGESKDELTSEELTVSQLAFIDKVDGIRRVDEQVLNQISQRIEPEINITYNYLHNLLLIRSSDEEALIDIAELIKDLDRPAKQVLLEVKVLDLELGKDKRSIFDLAYTGESTADGPNSSNNSNPLGGDPSVATSSVIAGLGNFAIEAGNTGIFQVINDNVLARVQLLESKDRIEVVSSPLLLASNNKVARLFIGEERLMTEGVRSTGGGVSTDGIIQPLYVEALTKIVPVGNDLEIWPRINDDRTVTLDLTMSNSTVLKNASTIPVSGQGGAVQEFPIDSINTTTMDLTVIAEEGHTIAVGGLIREESGSSEEKIPFLGDIPYLGKLFTKSVDNKFRKETILLITPYIFETSDEAHVKSLELLESQSENEIAADIWKDKTEVDSLAGMSPNDVDQNSVQLVINGLQYAANATHGTTTALPEGLSEGSADFSRWQVTDDIEASALQAWQYQGSFITSVLLNNQSYTNKKIELSWFGLGWQAVSMEQDLLSANDQVIVYLVSTQPASYLLAQQGKTFMYTAAGILQASKLEAK
ncbi:MAG: hypothetical protein GY787_16760 [Alteromonadales bacterium]|nr:hypothetical protein [Alteromonadales bacterium]